MFNKSLPPLDEYTFEFSKAPPATILDQLKQIVLAIWSFPKRFYNTCLLIRYQELKKTASKNVCPMRYLNPFYYLNTSAQIITKPPIIKAILKYSRKDSNGIFMDTDNAEIFLPLFRDLYPNEIITSDDFILTCNKEHLRKYRQPILRLIGPLNIEKHSQELQEIVHNTLQHFTNKNEEEIDGSEVSLTLTIAVISKLVLGHPGPFDAYKEFALAVDFVNKHIMKKAIDVSLNASGSFVEILQNEQSLTLLQIKLSLYSMYFASSDTTSALLSYLLWQLGQHPDLQEEIFQEKKSFQGDLLTYANESLAIDRLISESLRLFTPAYVIGRKPRFPLIFTIKNKLGNIVFQEKIGKNEKILNMITFAARDPSLFKNPDLFEPKRFKTRMKNYEWSPFGDGVHSCPGQWLAKTQIGIFVALLVQKYQISSSPDKEFEQLGYVTLKPSHKINLRLIERFDKE